MNLSGGGRYSRDIYYELLVNTRFSRAMTFSPLKLSINLSHKSSINVELAVATSMSRLV